LAVIDAAFGKQSLLYSGLTQLSRSTGCNNR